MAEGRLIFGCSSTMSSVRICMSAATGTSLVVTGGGTLYAITLSTPSSSQAHQFQGPMTIANGTVIAGVLDAAGETSSVGRNALIKMGSGDTNGTLSYRNSSVRSNINRQVQIGDDNLPAGIGGAVIENVQAPDALGSGRIAFTPANSFNLPVAASVNRSLTLGGNSTAGNSINPPIVDNLGLGGTISVVKRGTGVWQLGAENTYTGGMTIEARTLSIIGSVLNDIRNDGTLSFNSSTNRTFGGVISGTGLLYKQNTNTLTLTGQSTYAGGTTVKAGTLQLTGLLGNGPARGRGGVAAGSHRPEPPASSMRATGHASALMLLAAALPAAVEAVPTGSLDDAAIGHVRMPVQSLVFGRVEEAVAAHAATARRLLATVRPDGSVAYQPGKGGVDYGRTHDSDHANGLSARAVAAALESARFAGDRELLDQAVAWAWTGLPFLYLVDPVGTPDGPYGCVTVFGATAWKWPVWIGRPVQWCGLVYADALYRLARHDPGGPWRRLADGITATGIRYSWPRATAESSPDAVERQGLLPDGWAVLDMFPVDPPINPGTVQACAVELFQAGSLYDCRVLPFGDSRLIVHAPGGIEPVDDGPAGDGTGPAGPADRLAFRVSGWPKGPHAVYVTGLNAEPEVTLDGEAVEPAARRFDADSGRLVLRLDGPGTVEFWASPRTSQDLQPSRPADIFQLHGALAQGG